MDETTDDRARMARADLLTAVVLILLAVGIFYASWTMPRLENRGVHPLTVPALVPGGLSLLLLLCAALLGWRALRIPAIGGWQALGRLFTGKEALRVATLTGMALVYTLGLVGTLPFWAATAIFVFAFIILFEVYLTAEPQPLLSSLPWALGVALVTGVSVVLVFERLFLVRLP